VISIYCDKNLTIENFLIAVLEIFLAFSTRVFVTLLIIL